MLGMQHPSHLLASLSFAALLAACQPTASAGEDLLHKNGRHTLTIYGYNYTDQYIDSFEVDGRDGSNLQVSSPDAGGGKGTCCIGWREGTRLPKKVHIRWSADSCWHVTKPNEEGETYKGVHHIFKETDALLNGPVPERPGYFEVHFYPDEHVEVAISKYPSPPRLKLDKSRAKEMRQCTEEDLKK